MKCPYCTHDHRQDHIDFCRIAQQNGVRFTIERIFPEIEDLYHSVGKVEVWRANNPDLVCDLCEEYVKKVINAVAASDGSRSITPGASEAQPAPSVGVATPFDSVLRRVSDGRNGGSISPSSAEAENRNAVNSPSDGIKPKFISKCAMVPQVKKKCTDPNCEGKCVQIRKLLSPKRLIGPAGEKDYANRRKVK
jgi:hypothetical protein